MLGRIQFRRIGRHPLDEQPGGLRFDEFSRRFCRVGRQSIPEKDEFPSSQMPFKIFYVRNDIRRLHALFSDHGK